LFVVAEVIAVVAFTQVGPEAPSLLRNDPPPSPSATVVLRTPQEREISMSRPCEARFAAGEFGEARRNRDERTKSHKG
jgi:hypothetical protein